MIEITAVKERYRKEINIVVSPGAIWSKTKVDIEEQRNNFFTISTYYIAQYRAETVFLR